MDPMTIALIAGALILLNTKGKGAYGEASSKYLLTPGTYRTTFKATKPQTNSLQEIWAIPNSAMLGLGVLTRFEGFRVDAADPNVWWFTGTFGYEGTPKAIDLLPFQTLEKLS